MAVGEMVFSQENNLFHLHWKTAVVTLVKSLSILCWSWVWDRNWRKSSAQILPSWKWGKILAKMSKYNRPGGTCSQSLQDAAFNFPWLFGILNICSPLWRFFSEDLEHLIWTVRSAKAAPFYWRGRTAHEIPWPLSLWDPSFLFSQKRIFSFLSSSWCLNDQMWRCCQCSWDSPWEAEPLLLNIWNWT